MTREERLELLKQIEKDIYVPSIESTFLEDAKSCAIHSAIEELEQESCENCIKISEGMTNGDMIKAIFPNLNFKETKDFFERWIMNGGGIRCYIEWWNSPYRKDR